MLQILLYLINIWLHLAYSDNFSTFIFISRSSSISISLPLPTYLSFYLYLSLSLSLYHSMFIFLHHIISCHSVLLSLLLSSVWNISVWLLMPLENKITMKFEHALYLCIFSVNLHSFKHAYWHRAQQILQIHFGYSTFLREIIIGLRKLTCVHGMECLKHSFGWTYFFVLDLWKW